MSISKNIKVEQLGLSREELDVFSQLAIQVELRDRQRYTISKTVDQMVLLLNHAYKSKDAEINLLRIRILKMLAVEPKKFLSAMGAVDFGEFMPLVSEGRKSVLQADNRHKFGARS